MEQAELFPTHDLVVRKDGRVTRFNAGDAMAALIDVLSLSGIRLTPKLRARLGCSAKGALESGYTPEEVVTAMTEAVNCCRVDLVDQFLLEREMLEKRGYIKDPKQVWRDWTPQYSHDLAAQIGQMRARMREIENGFAA